MRMWTLKTKLRDVPETMDSKLVSISSVCDFDQQAAERPTIDSNYPQCMAWNCKHFAARFYKMELQMEYTSVFTLKIPWHYQVCDTYHAFGLDCELNKLWVYCYDKCLQT